MDIKNEIIDYIKMKETPGSLLVTGKWGCGKSYLIKEIANELNQTEEYAISIISLFGIEDFCALNKKIKSAYLDQTASFINVANKVIKAAGKPVENVADMLSTIIPGATVIKAITSGVSAFSSTDTFDLIKVKNIIKNNDIEKPFVLVFDDLERTSIEIKTLLGIINDYSENYKIKTVVIADETKIEEGNSYYNRFKEKVVFRTVLMEADYRAIITSIASNYSETAEGYASFLQANTDRLFRVYHESETDNLRVIKCAISDFERAFELWKARDIDTKYMPDVLYSFIAEIYLYKVIYKEKEKTHKISSKEDATKSLASAINETSSLSSRFADKGKNSSDFESLKHWIESGEWFPELFTEELVRKYSYRKYRAYEKFLTFNIWSLNQKDIDNGWKQAEKLAREGKLDIEEYVELLRRGLFLKDKGYQHEIDYEGISNGVDKKIEKLKADKAIIQPRVSTYIDNNTDPRIKEISQKLDRIEHILWAWEYRSEYIEFLKKKSELSRTYFNNKPISTFDNELKDIFLKAYFNGNNGFKQTCGISLIYLQFDVEPFSMNSDIKQSLANLLIVRDKIKASISSEKDIITRSLSEEIVHKLDDKIASINARIKS